LRGGRIEDEDEDEDDDENEGNSARAGQIMSVPNTASHGTARKLAARERHR